MEKDFIVKLSEALPAIQRGIRESLRGKVAYGSFEFNQEIAVRKNADGTKDYGHFDEQANFIPFSEEELRRFSLQYGVVPGRTADVLAFKKHENEE